MNTYQHLITELLRALKDGLLPSADPDGVWAMAGWVNVQTFHWNRPSASGYLVRVPVPEGTHSRDVRAFLVASGLYSEAAEWSAAMCLKGHTVVPNQSQDDTLDAIKLSRGGRWVLMDQYRAHSKTSREFITTLTTNTEGVTQP